MIKINFSWIILFDFFHQFFHKEHINFSRVPKEAVPFLQGHRTYSNQDILDSKFHYSKRRNSCLRNQQLRFYIWNICLTLYLDSERSCCLDTSSRCFYVSQRIACWYRGLHLPFVFYVRWIYLLSYRSLVGPSVSASQDRNLWCIDDSQIQRGSTPCYTLDT